MNAQIDESIIRRAREAIATAGERHTAAVAQTAACAAAASEAERLHDAALASAATGGDSDHVAAYTAMIAAQSAHQAAVRFQAATLAARDAAIAAERKAHADAAMPVLREAVQKRIDAAQRYQAACAAAFLACSDFDAAAEGIRIAQASGLDLQGAQNKVDRQTVHIQQHGAMPSWALRPLPDPESERALWEGIVNA